MKITDVKDSRSGTPAEKSVIRANTKGGIKKDVYQWWKCKTSLSLRDELIATLSYLKDRQGKRQQETALFAKLYGNQTLFGYQSKNLKTDNRALPIDRPTFNLIQSATDTLVSRITQNRPAPIFLTDNSDYKERNLAKKLNNFILGEFYQCKAYEKAEYMLRDALVTGTGCMKVFKGEDKKVKIERVLLTELFTDHNDSIYGEPRQLYQIKLVDRGVLMENFSKYRADIEAAEAAFPDNSSSSSNTTSDMVMVVEGWHLPSGPDAKDGRHTIACSTGILYDDKSYDKEKFPFVFLHYSPRFMGFWSQGLAEQLMGTQLEINSLLYTISKSIKLVGVPRVFVEDGSKVIKSHLNNDIGAIVTYQGEKPEYSVAPCVPEELYAQLQRLIGYGYQQCGVSALEASSQKPAGLNSGEAIRSYDDITTDRSAALSKRYDNVFKDLAHLVIEEAKEIAEDEDSYSTVYPNKNGIKEIDLPKASILQDAYVIQCFTQSSLPRDPAGRLAKVTEMAQSGIISMQEARRLLDYPDLGQAEALANASEERVFQILDDIVEDGKYTQPDPFLDLDFAIKTTTQYLNMYGSAKLEEEKQQQLRDFFSQCQSLVQVAQTPPPGAMPPGAPGAAPQQGAQPQAVPEAPPTSPLLPNSPGQAA